MKPNPIRKERLSATLEGDFAVFLIGMRINNPLLVHKWLPVVAAMPRMLEELHRNPELGFLHSEMWLSRTIIVLQYWRSMEQLLAYAKNRGAAHLPAWQAFNRSVGRTGSVGIWHETYAVSPGGYENIYVNMPAFGLAAAVTHLPADRKANTAAARIAATTRNEPAVEPY